MTDSDDKHKRLVQLKCRSCGHRDVVEMDHEPTEEDDIDCPKCNGLLEPV